MAQSIATKCVQGGYHPGDGEPRQVPIYQSTTWKYDTSEHMGKLFDLEESSGYVLYSFAESLRMIMWRQKLLNLKAEQQLCSPLRVKRLTFLPSLISAGNGDHIVASSAIYGGTYNLFAHTMERMGLGCTFA